MSDNTSIEWTEATWNPVTGCKKVSTGCRNCYAERMALRLQAMGKNRYRNGFAPTTHVEALKIPFGWNKPKIVFVNSMSDLFQSQVPVEFVQSIFEVMNRCPQHTFQVLTKRPNIAERYASQLKWTKNIWLGTSIENQKATRRIHNLRRIPAAIKFLSVEPLLGPIPRLPIAGIDWVIVGGESGPRARPMDERWVRQIRDRCVDRGVPFFFKQWGGVNKKMTGRILDGETWDEMPPIPAVAAA